MDRRTEFQKFLVDFGLKLQLVFIALGHPFFVILRFLLKTLIKIIPLVFYLLFIFLKRIKKETGSLIFFLSRISKKLTLLSFKPRLKKPTVLFCSNNIFYRLKKDLLKITSKSKKKKQVSASARKQKTKKPRRLVLKLIITLIVIFISSLTASYLVSSFFKDLPSPRKLSTADQIQTTKIYDRNGKLLYKIYREKDRSWINLDQLPKNIIQATISIEDKEFYKHQGVSIRGMGRAIYLYLFEKKKTGGSTITQQLIKNTLLTPEKTWRRKIKEIVLALMVERIYTKDQILEMYLNEVGYGGATYGIEEAGQKYFGISARQLTLAQASFLAGLPASPTTYSPFGDNLQLAKIRQSLVLKAMLENGYISKEEKDSAQAENLQFSSQKIEIEAPHFVMFVKDLLIKKYGRNMVEQGGLEVKTSLDLSIQKSAEDIVKKEIGQLAHLKITNGAALITNPKTGEILAMVGSKDYFAKDIDGNYNITTAERQPGSSIKPINYSIALENGFTPATLIDDSPIVYKVPGQPPYEPKNYDNRYHGQIPLRIALGSSYNVPAVKILAAFGVQKMIERGRLMGITTWNDPARYGLSLTLGGGEIKMTDLAVAYGTLANSGVKTNLNPILEVKNNKGTILESNPAGKQTPVLKPQTSYLLTTILADNSARTPAFGSNSLLNIPGREIAVKTGTTQNLRDNWTIGYSPSLLIAVWVGNNDNSPMSYVASGVTGASPIWRNIMNNLLKNKPTESFLKPEGIKEVYICQNTNTLPCEHCPVVKKEYFLEGTEPKSACDPQFFKNPTPTP